MITGKPAIAVLLLASLAGVAQTAPAKPAGPPSNCPHATAPKPSKKADHAAAYYHYAMAHMYEELVAMYGRPSTPTRRSTNTGWQSRTTLLRGT